jgi:hypothetical protein
MKETILSAVVALIVAVGAVAVFAPSTNNGPSVGGIASPDVYSYMNVKGAFSQGGELTTVTQTAATVTLTSSQLRDANVITFTASTTQPALTATLPASTTFPIGQEAGSYRDWVIINPFTGAATTTTIAAGTGIDLQEPDGQNVVIGINNFAWLTCFRKVDTNIVCKVDETIPAD